MDIMSWYVYINNIYLIIHLILLAQLLNSIYNSNSVFHIKQIYYLIVRYNHRYKESG